MYLSNYDCYKEVINHRMHCSKWQHQKQCMKCFGGGLSIFTEKLLMEIIRRE